MGVSIVDPMSAIRFLSRRPAVRVAEEANLSDAATAMREANVSSVLVGHHNLIVTERDLTRALALGLDPNAGVITVSSLFIEVSPDTSVVDAAALMLNQEVRHLVFQSADGRETVVSLRDLMAVLLQAVTPHVWLEALRVALIPAR